MTTAEEKSAQIDQIAMAYRRGQEAMQRAAANVAVEARRGDRDPDLRSVIAGIRALPVVGKCRACEGSGWQMYPMPGGVGVGFTVCEACGNPLRQPSP